MMTIHARSSVVEHPIPNRAVAGSIPAGVANNYCRVAQLVARWAHNPEVVGSSPAPATEQR